MQICPGEITLYGSPVELSMAEERFVCFKWRADKNVFD